MLREGEAIPPSSAESAGISVLALSSIASLTRWLVVVSAPKRKGGEGGSPIRARPVVLSFPTSGRSGEVRIATHRHRGDHSYRHLCT